MKVYVLFMVALIFFNLYEGQTHRFMRTFVYMIVGAMLLFILCAAGMDFVGWVLLILPVLFVMFILVILVFDQGFLFEHEYKNRLRCGAKPSPTPTCPPSAPPAPAPAEEPECEPEPEPEPEPECE
jgi:hypothetical protein